MATGAQSQCIDALRLLHASMDSVKPTLDLQGNGMIEQAAEDRGGDRRVAENFAPGAELARCQAHSAQHGQHDRALKGAVARHRLHPAAVLGLIKQRTGAEAHHIFRHCLDCPRGSLSTACSFAGKLARCLPQVTEAAELSKE